MPEFCGATLDSRLVKPGMLFVAVKGSTVAVKETTASTSIVCVVFGEMVTPVTATVASFTVTMHSAYLLLSALLVTVTVASPAEMGLT